MPRHRLWVEDYAKLLGSLLNTLGVTSCIVIGLPDGRLQEIPGHRHLVHYSAADHVADSIVDFAGIRRGPAE
jgi:trans-aconitate methyltransferase